MLMRIGPFFAFIIVGILAIQTHGVAAQTLPSFALDPPPAPAPPLPDSSYGGNEPLAVPGDQANGRAGTNRPVNDLAKSVGASTDKTGTGLNFTVGNDFHVSLHMVGAAAGVSEVRH